MNFFQLPSPSLAFPRAMVSGRGAAGESERRIGRAPAGTPRPGLGVNVGGLPPALRGDRRRWPGGTGERYRGAAAAATGEEEEGHASETEEDKSHTFRIPRPNSTLHPNAANPADLSSYTPKHSVKFSEWQEQKYEEMPAKGPLLKEADSQGNQVMLTPAEKGGLSDFSSEPALYF